MSQENLAKKKEIVRSIGEKVKKAKSVVLVDYRGLTVLEDTALRAELRKSKVEYKVLKNRLVLRALNDCGYTGFDKQLEGPTAVAFGYDDAVAPAKILAKAAESYNKTSIKGGVVEGKIMSAAQMGEIAKLPSRETLIAQLLGLLTSPVRSLAVALSEVAKKKEA